VRTVKKKHYILDDLRSLLFGEEKALRTIAAREVQVSSCDRPSDQEDDGEEGKSGTGENSKTLTLPAYSIFESDRTTARRFLAARPTSASNWTEREVEHIVAILRQHSQAQIHFGGKDSEKYYNDDTLDRADEVAMVCLFLDKAKSKNKYAKGAILVDGKPRIWGTVVLVRSNGGHCPSPPSRVRSLAAGPPDVDKPAE